MLTFRSLAPLAAAAVLSFAALPAAAAVVACQFGTEAEFTATADVWTSTSCVGQITGNDSDQDAGSGVVNVNTVLDQPNTNDVGLFNISNWVLDSRYDQDLGTYDPDGILNISNVTSNLFQGEWSVDSWDGVQSAMLVLKGGNGFAAYLLDLTAGLSGEWITQALTNRGGQTPAISHISLYTVEVAAVPVPAAGLLLIGALGGLALLRRRRTL